MADDDPFTGRSELEEALRRHFRDEVARTDFQPFRLDELQQPRPAPVRPRRNRWLLAAAAGVAVVVGATQLIIGQLTQGPVTAIPASATPSAGPVQASTAPLWTPRLPAPVDVERYAQVGLNGSVYLLAGRSTEGTCRLDGYRYQPGADLWQQLADGPARGRQCAASYAFASGSRIYVMIDAGAKATGDRMELYAYDTVDNAWTTFHDAGLPDDSGCTPVGLDEGIFCLDQSDEASGAPIGYHRFSFADRRWTSAAVQPGGGRTRLSVAPLRVNLAVGERVLLDTRLPSGGIVLTDWDPATGRFAELTEHAGTGAELGAAQLTADGTAYFNPPADPAGQGIPASDPRATTGLAVELGQARWQSVVVPHPGGPLISQTPSDAGWALRYYGAQASGYVNANGYLYRPDRRSWLAIAPLPAPEAGKGRVGWVGSALQCQRAAPRNCWGLSARPLAELATPLDQAAIEASNARVG